jgi:hypothetical protein
MPFGFEISIDESRDEGSRFRGPGVPGSSEWLVLSALMVPRESIPDVTAAMRKVRALFGRPEDYSLHFADLSHGQRVAWVSHLAMLKNVRVASIIIHKPRLQKRALFSECDRLYFYGHGI